MQPGLGRSCTGAPDHTQGLLPRPQCCRQIHSPSLWSIALYVAGGTAANCSHLQPKASSAGKEPSQVWDILEGASLAQFDW